MAPTPDVVRRSPPPVKPGFGQRWRAVALTALAAALLQGCGTAPVPASSDRAALGTRSERSAAMGREVALHALALLDRGYRYGGRDIDVGLDCSGLVSHVYREAIGMELRGNAAAMAHQARPVSTELLQPGDLLFFNTLGQPRSHVGVYVGNGHFVHAANARSGIRLDQLSNRYYASRFEGARALLY